MRLSVLLSVLLVCLSINQARAQSDCAPLSDDRVLEAAQALGYRGNGGAFYALLWLLYVGNVCENDFVTYSASNYIDINQDSSCHFVEINAGFGYSATFRLVDMEDYRCGGDPVGIIVIRGDATCYSLCDCFEENNGLASVTGAYVLLFAGKVKAKIGYLPVALGEA